MLLLPTILVILLCGRCQSAAPSEFLRSFLNRPGLLPDAKGAKGPREPLSKDTLSFSVVVDNWSKYSLVYSQYAVTEGALDARYEKKSSISNLLKQYRVHRVVRQLDWVDVDLQSCSGWWAGIVATYSPVLLCSMVEHPKTKSAQPSC